MTHAHSRRSVLAGALSVLAAPPVLAQSLGARPATLTEHGKSLSQLHSLVVKRESDVVFAEAFRGPALDRTANIKSVSKTLVALLTGAAVDRRLIAGPEAKVLPLLERAPFGDARDDLTIGHLLSMQAGLESTSGANYGAWISSRDWLNYALTQPLVDVPGGRFIYSTGSWHILGAALSNATGMSLLEMAREWLGAPLAIEVPSWVRDPQGRYLGGNEMALTPQAMARIGDMILGRGRLDGEQIIASSWIEACWQPRARSPWSGDYYGYGFFLTRFGDYEARYGRGYGGQLLVIVPELSLSIAITSDPSRPARSGGYFSDLRDLVRHAIETAENA